jgi:hypothetical protein
VQSDDDDDDDDDELLGCDRDQDVVAGKLLQVRLVPFDPRPPAIGLWKADIVADESSSIDKTQYGALRLYRQRFGIVICGQTIVPPKRFSPPNRLTRQCD